VFGKVFVPEPAYNIGGKANREHGMYYSKTSVHTVQSKVAMQVEEVFVNFRFHKLKICVA
jgi:hypothetical protein